MIAALPMYDRPEIAGSWDRLWHLFIEAYGDGPAALTRTGDLWDIWQSPDLLLAQTCGFPYRSRLKDKVALVGSPDHGLPSLPAGHYCSVIVAATRHEGHGVAAFDGARLAYNEALSQSGWAAVWRHFDSQNLRIGSRLLSGSHRDSARMVAQGQADFASLDIVSWTLMRRYDDFAGKLTVIDHTMATPALPFVTAGYRDVAPIQKALHMAIGALTPGQRTELLLQGLVDVPQSAYEAVPNPPSP